MGSLISTSSLLTDLYQLTMAFGYWKEGLRDDWAIFHYFFRRPPFKGGYVVSCGLEPLIDQIKKYSFNEEECDYLFSLKDNKGNKLFTQEFITYLKNLEFSFNMSAVPEGTIVFPFQPILKVEGPIIQCQLLESLILNQLNFPSLIATKASRVCQAAQGDEIYDFGLRRAQGADGALSASRAAFIGGCSATSNLLAGKLYSIPVRGTHSHSWVMMFTTEEEAFRAYSEALPDHCVFLVDTYSTLEGVKSAISVGKDLRKKGKELSGIRIDSGDLAFLSIEARKLLDKSGFHDTKIIASNELDEFLIQDLKQQKAQISIWGVGTKLVTGDGGSALDGVYKLSSTRKKGSKSWKPKIKISEQLVKVSNPGNLQVRRFYENGKYRADMIYDMDSFHEPESFSIVDPLDETRQMNLSSKMKSKDLLQPVFKGGKDLYSKKGIKDLQQFVKGELKLLDDGIKRFVNPHSYVVGLEMSLFMKKKELIKKLRS